MKYKMKKQKENKLKSFNIYAVEDEYAPNYSIFDDDEEEVKKIKYIIYNKLS